MIIPNKIGTPRHPAEIQVSPEIMEVSVSEPEQVYQQLRTSNQGLSAAEAARRLKKFGPNTVAQDERHNRLRLLGRALLNPLVILLSILAVIGLPPAGGGPPAGLPPDPGGSQRRGWI
jgi:P-type Mg2+ transporter